MNKTTPILALAGLLAIPPARSEILVGLDPADSLYDGGAVDDAGAAGSASGMPLLNDASHQAGFTFNSEITPVAGDLTGTIMIAEVGGTSNGSGIYLIDGVPTVLTKQSSGDAAVPAGLTSPALPAVSVQSSSPALTAGSSYSISASWDHRGTLELIVKPDGGTRTIDTFTITGNPGNWSGNDTFSAGFLTNRGSTGGLSGANAENSFGPPFDVDGAFAFAGTLDRVIFWNAAWLSAPEAQAPALEGFEITKLGDSGNLRAHWSVIPGTLGDPLTVVLSDGSSTITTSAEEEGFFDFNPGTSSDFTLTVSNATGSDSQTTGIPVENAFSTIVRNDNPVAYFRFLEQEGSTLIVDSADNSAPHDGIATGGVFTSATGAVDGAASFDGTGSILSDLILNPGEVFPGFTIEAIARRTPWPDSPWDNPTIVSQQNLAGTGRLNLSVTPTGNITTFLGGGNFGVRRPSNVTYYEDSWCHLAIVADASTSSLRFYLDGQLVADTSNSANPEVADVFLEATTGAHVIGSNKSQTGDFWLGEIDEIAIYDRLLDDPDGDGDFSDSLLLAHRDAFVSAASGLLSFGTRTPGIEAGTSARLDIKVGPDVTSVSVDNGVGILPVTNGSATAFVRPAASTVYTVTATSPSGQQTKSVSVEVTPNTSILEIRDIIPNEGGGFTITFLGSADQSYVITGSTDGLNFLEISDDPIVDDFGNGSGTVPPSANPKQLYRIELAQ